MIVGCSCKVHAVRRPCDIRQALCMPIQITDELPRERRPYLSDVVSSFSKICMVSDCVLYVREAKGGRTAGSQQRSIRAELDGGYRHGMSAERVRKFIAWSRTRVCVCVRWGIGRSGWWRYWCRCNDLWGMRLHWRRNHCVLTFGDLGVIFGGLGGSVIFCRRIVCRGFTRWRHILRVVDGQSREKRASASAPGHVRVKL